MNDWNSTRRNSTSPPSNYKILLRAGCSFCNTAVHAVLMEWEFNPNPNCKSVSYPNSKRAKHIDKTYVSRTEFSLGFIMLRCACGFKRERTYIEFHLQN